MVEETIIMKNVIELRNYEVKEYCTLSRNTGNVVYYNGKKKTPGFTGLYFRDSKTFFAIYPTKEGPKIYYKNKEYDIDENIEIILVKEDKKRIFKIPNYNLSIEYVESKYIDFDNWSSEIDVDLFFMIYERYKSKEFYEQYTVN